MKEQDLARFAAIVREFHRQNNLTRSRNYSNACDALQDEIGEERMHAAREEYDEQQFRQAEAAEDRRIEDHYR